MEAVQRAAKVCRAGAYQALCDCDTPPDTGDKRLGKAVDRTLDFMEKSLQFHGDSVSILSFVIQSSIA